MSKASGYVVFSAIHRTKKKSILENAKLMKIDLYNMNRKQVSM